MAVTAFTPPPEPPLTFASRREGKGSIVSCSDNSTYSTSSSWPELTSPIFSTSAKAFIVTPESLNDSPCAIVPKVEELDDGASSLNKVQDIVEAKLYHTEEGPRKRGRPRKYPVVEQKKSTHIRSKTGCKTCRRRKKKCDEGRPSCQNCEKNNVLCEGYEDKKPWRSGKQKALEQDPSAEQKPQVEQKTLDLAFVKQNSPVEVRTVVARPMPTQQAWASEDDYMTQRIWHHYTKKLSGVLSVNDHYNPFYKLVLPMAIQHEGVKASVLYLSASSLMANSTTVDELMLARQTDACTNAVASLNEQISNLKLGDTGSDEHAAASVGDPLIAQTLLLCLQTICSGDLEGRWQGHLRALKYLLSQAPQACADTQFRQFVLEFLVYHDYSSAITAFENPLNDQSSQLMESFGLPAMTQTHAATLLGVTDGLFGYIARIRKLRDELRYESNHGVIPATSYAEAHSLHEELANWVCPYAEDTPRYWASLLYRQCVCLYLHRTTMPSKPCTAFKVGVDDGLEYLRRLPCEEDDSATQSTQSILLMPLFLLGCSAFELAQRLEIAEAFDRLQKWSSLGNIKYAREIVQEIWQMMDDGRAEETWYWEGVIQRRGWNFLIT